MSQTTLPFYEDSPFKGKGTVTKQMVCSAYQFSRSTFASLFNVRYFKQLESVGYTKESVIISPKVINKFVEIYGEPL